MSTDIKQSAPFKLTSETVIEPCPIDDTFCPVVVGIEPLGPCHRVTFAVPQTIYSNDDERLVATVAKLVLTDEALAALASAIPQYFAQRNGKVRQPNAAPRSTSAVN